MANTGVIYTCATLVVLLYSLYASYLLSWKLDAGPVLYFVIFVCSFLLLRLAVSPLIELWSRVPLTDQEVATKEPQMNANTCSALFTDPSTGDLMDAMTGYIDEPPSHFTCPAGLATPPTTVTPGQPISQTTPAESTLPSDSSFFHYCVPVKPSRPLGSSTRASQAATQRKTSPKNRYSFYSEY